MTTLFPLYDFARVVAKDRFRIVLLLPPGVEAHSFEPSPGDIELIGKSALFIHQGGAMQPWVQKILQSLEGGKTVIVDASAGAELSGYDGKAHEHGENPAIHGEKDPHIWLDPELASGMVESVVKGLVAADPAGSNFYASNGAAFRKELEKLDADFREMFGKTRVRTIVYAGHFAFGYFARRYGLGHVSPYAGFSPDAEPSFRRIVELMGTMKELGVDSVFHEELIDPKVARIIAEQTGAKMLLLHAAHNVSRKELEDGATYLSIMRENMQKLKTGMGYAE